VRGRGGSTTEGAIRPLWLWAWIVAFTATTCAVQADGPGPVVAVKDLGLTVRDMDRSVEFFTRVLSFVKTSDVEVAGEAFERLHGVFGARARVVRLKLGDEALELTEYLAPRGRSIPEDARSNDRSFQHVAIIVSDMAAAYRRLREHKVVHASSGPQRLPDWNPNAGGIEAFYFKDPDVEIALVNRENHFVFQPLLPEVAAGAILPTQMVNPIRRMLKRTQFFASEVEAIRLDQREVDVLVGEGKHLRILPYDHLVVALGTIVDLSSLPGMSEHSIPFKNVGDAFYLRNHVIGCLEQADIETDPDLKKALLTFVVVGGGFSGVETIGELQEMVQLVLYRNVAAKEVRFVLVHSQERILPEVVPGLGRYAERQLTSRGIEIKLNTRCNAATAGQVFLASGEMIPNRTLVCTVGNAPNPMLARLGCPTHRGRIVAEETLAVPRSPGVWALGDCASIPDRYTGQPYAPTAQNAIRQAVVCADNIVATLRGRPMRPFAFRGLGKLASIGGRSAVAEILGLKVSGFPAWWLWRTIYLMKLPGWERRMRVARPPQGFELDHIREAGAHRRPRTRRPGQMMPRAYGAQPCAQHNRGCRLAPRRHLQRSRHPCRIIRLSRERRRSC